jgi:hypothetical protein
MSISATATTAELRTHFQKLQDSNPELTRWNARLTRRVEVASPYAPLATLPPEQFRLLARAASNAATWEDVPVKYRALIEAAEDNKRQAELTTARDTSSTPIS